jgi:hypothetical protein
MQTFLPRPIVVNLHSNPAGCLVPMALAELFELARGIVSIGLFSRCLLVLSFTMTSSTAFKQFSLENDMQDVTEDSGAMDSIYKHDSEGQKEILVAKPWATEYASKIIHY